MTNEQPAPSAPPAPSPPPGPPPPPDPQPSQAQAADPPADSAPAPAPPPVLTRGWLRSLLRGIRQHGVPPRDPRVRALWVLLRRRQVLDRNAWLKATLRRIWQNGLGNRHRPRTTVQMLALLRAWGVLRPRPLARYAAGGIRRPVAIRPLQRLRPVTLHRVATARPLHAMRPLQAMSTGLLPLEVARAVWSEWRGHDA